MLNRYSLLMLVALPIASAAWAAGSTDQVDPNLSPGADQQQIASKAPVLTVPPPDFSLAHPDKLSPMDDIPSSGSSDQYVHGPNEGPVPGASQYRLGGPPPNAQGLLGGD